MLNYETLLSSYDDKLTLMQWLKKVEKALAGASASSFEVIKTGNATIRFRINFEDETYLESGDMVLQQGESVSSGEIRNGHLYLTLTNGQELDCGTLFNGEISNMQVRALEVTGGLIVGDDANATVGGDLSVHGLTEVQNLLAYGHVETETLTASGDEITAEKPVVEVMNGYTFGSVAVNGLTYEQIYAGVVKNGNKLTIVHALKITRTEAQSGISKNISYFVVPNSIAGKLFSTNIAGYDVLLFMQANAIKNDTSFIPVKAYIDKYGQKLNINLQGSTIDDLPLNSPVYLRIEATFLLSENLAA